MTRVPLTNGVLHTVVAGSGDPLLLIHGFPLDHSMWSAQIEHFAATHRVIAPDLRGFGQSTVTSGIVTMEEFADDLVNLLGALEITSPIALCGLSMGGYIALAFARRHRDRLEKLILCDTRASADAQETREQRAETAERVRREGTGFLATGMIERLFARQTREESPELIRGVQAVIRSETAEGGAEAALGMSLRADATLLLGELEQPVLVLVGAEDAITPPEEMREMAGRMPNAQYVEIARAGHMAPLEQPAATNAAISSVLSGEAV